MTRHAYPTSAMLGDYFRAAVGFVSATAILATVPVDGVAAAVLVGFAALFAAFGVRTALRHGTRIEAAEGAVRAAGLCRSTILWSELDRMKLAYYSTRRDGRGGWMQLELRSGSSTLRADSRIAGFPELVRASAKAAEIRDVALSETTLLNLQALGIEPRTTESGLREAAVDMT